MEGQETGPVKESVLVQLGRAMVCQLGSAVIVKKWVRAGRPLAQSPTRLLGDGDGNEG